MPVTKYAVSAAALSSAQSTEAEADQSLTISAPTCDGLLDMCCQAQPEEATFTVSHRLIRAGKVGTNRAHAVRTLFFILPYPVEDLLHTKLQETSSLRGSEGGYLKIQRSMSNTSIEA